MAFVALEGVQTGHMRNRVATTANYFATRRLALFSRRYRGTNFSHGVNSRKTLPDQLAANDADLVIMAKPPDRLDLDPTPLMERPLAINAPPQHPLDAQQTIRLARLQDEVFVAPEQQSGNRIATVRFFQDCGIQPKTRMEMSTNSVIKHAVEAGLDLGIVSVHTLELELEADRLVILDVEGFPVEGYWYPVTYAGKRLPPMVRAFFDFPMGEYAVQFMPPGQQL